MSTCMYYNKQYLTYIITKTTPYVNMYVLQKQHLMSTCMYYNKQYLTYIITKTTPDVNMYVLQ